MIISDKYKYVFLEIPHTGSTAISKELREKYGGKDVLYKHANYHEFLEVAKPEQKKYFVFAGVRNPLDEAVSLYHKFLNDHKNNYTDPSKLLRNGGWVTQRKIEIFNLVQANKNFEEFLRKFYRFPYTSNININKKYCDYIMKFENLEEDFTDVLKRIGAKKVRPLPVVNKTDKRGDFQGYYDNEQCTGYATKLFGPFMKEWGYELPGDWTNSLVKPHHRLTYNLGKLGRSLYSKYVRGGPLKKTLVLRNIAE